MPIAKQMQKNARSSGVFYEFGVGVDGVAVNQLSWMNPCWRA